MHEPMHLMACVILAVLGSLLLLLLLADLGQRQGRRQRRRWRWRDSQRLFTYEQKRILLARAGGRCEHKSLLFPRCAATTRLEADHVMPWSRGGPTQVWNGAVLCHRHNCRKSHRVPTLLYRWRLARRRKKRAPRTT